MMKDLESLQHAEQSLIELQNRWERKQITDSERDILSASIIYVTSYFISCYEKAH